MSSFPLQVGKEYLMSFVNDSNLIKMTLSDPGDTTYDMHVEGWCRFPGTHDPVATYKIDTRGFNLIDQYYTGCGRPDEYGNVKALEVNYIFNPAPYRCSYKCGGWFGTSTIQCDPPGGENVKIILPCEDKEECNVSDKNMCRDS
jgi:hypothetical protein